MGEIDWSNKQAPAGQKYLFDGTLVSMDTPTRNGPIGRVLLTSSEIFKLQNEEEKDRREKPLREWRRKIEASDNDIPRWAEDIIDALDETTKQKISKQTLDKYERKKTLRSEKPGG